MRRYGLRDDQWERIRDLLPGREGHVGVSARDNRAVHRSGALSLPRRHTVARSAGTLRRWDQGASALQSLVEVRRLGKGVPASGGGCRQRIRDDRQHHRARPSAQRRHPKKAGEDQAIGRSRGGLSTKIHTLVDALGNPVGFIPDRRPGPRSRRRRPPTPVDGGRHADRRQGVRCRQPGSRTAGRSRESGCDPTKANRLLPRDFDRDLYKERHLIANFFAKLKQFRAIATRYDKTARNFLSGVHIAATAIWLN